MSRRFNPPPGWPPPPPGWVPPAGWSPDPSWPPLPKGWELWIAEDATIPANGSSESRTVSSTGADTPAPARPDVARPSSSTRCDGAEAQQVTTDNWGALAELDDSRVLQEAGVYRYHHPLESAAAYKSRLEEIEQSIAALIKSGCAIEMAEDFTLNNSLAQGRRLSTDLAKLMLRAYNAEVENAVRSMKAGNIQTALQRVERSRTAIAKLGSLMEMQISDRYHQLRIQELELTSDWLVKKQEERDAAREERARLREEARVQRELEEERARLDKERAHLMNTLNALRLQGRQDPELEERLTAVDRAIEDNDFRAANIRAGYIYVISNQGAFGEGVVKIGLTRRLQPLDRIAELSGASVPFKFDVHALFFSEDAVSLELELHRHFADRALNRANTRKEFFFATPLEVRDALLQRVGNILEFTDTAEATEYLQSLRWWPEGRRPTT